ncbi:MAG: type VI secretion system baseplate subunit TssG [Holosporales bacterium]|jgi:type VI secretion system ImpH/TssG family protein|nr:type VI secretion system baseplate subunit TssG [Holosporales bacterium]
MFSLYKRRRNSGKKARFGKIIDERRLVDKLTNSPEMFTFARAIDVAFSLQGVKPSSIEIKNKINYSSKFSAISTMECVINDYVELYTNLPGIAGIEGAFPSCYVEEYITHNRLSRQAVADFFDIFNGRMYWLRYQFHKKHDLSCLSSSLENSIFGNIGFSLSGFGDSSSAASRNLSAALVPEQFKLSCHSFFWRNTRSSDGLRVILSSFFDVPVQIQQFVGAFDVADRSLQSAIGTSKNRFNKMGKDLILGNKSWNTMKGINVMIGPLNFDKYLKFLPKSNRLDRKVSPLQKMKEIVRSYVPCEFQVKLSFYLDECFVKGTLLNGVYRLNKDTFIYGEHTKGSRSLSKPPESDLMEGDPEHRIAAYLSVRENSSTGSTRQKTDYEELGKGSTASFTELV